MQGKYYTRSQIVFTCAMYCNHSSKISKGLSISMRLSTLQMISAAARCYIGQCSLSTNLQSICLLSGVRQIEG